MPPLRRSGLPEPDAPAPVGAVLSPEAARRALRSRALALLSRRDRTRAELESRLAPLAQSPAVLAAVLDELTAQSLLSDARFVESRSHALARRYGSLRVRQSLMQSGADGALVEAALQELRPAELERARALLRQRFSTPATTPLERARRQRFLQARGFSFDIISRAVRQADGD
jgi:regulatory protein